MIKFENHSNGRYYYIYTERDLLGDDIVYVIRGGLHRRGILKRIVIQLDVQEKSSSTDKIIAQITKTRLKRGYTLVN